MPREFDVVPSAYTSLLKVINYYALNKKIPSNCDCCFDPDWKIIFDKAICRKFISPDQISMKFTLCRTDYADVYYMLNMWKDEFLDDFLNQLENNTPKIEEWGTDIKINPPSLMSKNYTTVKNINDLIKELNYYVKNKKLSFNCNFYQKNDNIFDKLTPEEEEEQMTHGTLPPKSNWKKKFDDLWNDLPAVYQYGFLEELSDNQP